MAILDIINHIDAYLSRLRLARDILAQSLPDSPANEKDSKPTAKKAPSAASNKTHSSARTQSKIRRTSRTSAQTAAVAVAHVPCSSPMPSEDLASLSNAVSITVPEMAALSTADAGNIPPVPDVHVERLPYRGPRGSIRSSHARGLKLSEPTHGTGALVSSVNSKVVVVSPELAKKERERAAQPEIQPRAVFKSGLTGKLAFESLFRDTSDRSS